MDPPLDRGKADHNHLRQITDPNRSVVAVGHPHSQRARVKVRVKVRVKARVKGNGGKAQGRDSAEDRVKLRVSARGRARVPVRRDAVAEAVATEGSATSNKNYKHCSTDCTRRRVLIPMSVGCFREQTEASRLASSI